MRFGVVIQTTGVPEWQAFYVDYRNLKRLISPYIKLSKLFTKTRLEKEKIVITNFSQNEIDSLQKFHKYFKAVLYFELVKVSKFFTAKLNDSVEKWKLILINVALLQSGSITKDYAKKKLILKEAFFNYYKELNFLDEFLKINFEAFRKILKKHKKYVQHFNLSNIEDNFFRVLEMSNAKEQKNRLDKLTDYVENEYLITFYKKHNRKDGISDIRQINEGEVISTKNLFKFGLFFGFAIFVLILIISLFANKDSDIEDKKLITIFPLFRGTAIYIFYLWLLGWNIYGWTTCHINYKLLFGFKYHHSSFIEIIGRAAFFTTIFLLMLLLFSLLISAPESNVAKELDFIPIQVTPLIVWLVLVGYLFFPYLKIFNGPGRLFTIKVFLEMIKSIILVFPITFRVAWLADQLVSFAIPLRDTAYLFCYLPMYFSNKPDDTIIDVCLSNKESIVFFLVAFVPLCIKTLQVIRQTYDFRSFNPYGFNIAKYLISLLTCIFSYLTGLNDEKSGYLTSWIILASLNTFCTYIWDLKYDWNLLQRNSKYRFLRPTLAYNSTWWYYAGILLNIFLRVNWTLTISLNVLFIFTDYQLLILLIGFLEICRRIIWNFFRLEKDHIVNIGGFRAIEPLRLPFNQYGDSLDSEANIKFKEELRFGKEIPFLEKNKNLLIHNKPIEELIPGNMIAHDFTEDITGLSKKMPNRNMTRSQANLFQDLSSVSKYYLSNEVPFSPTSLKKLTVPDFHLNEWINEAIEAKKQILQTAKRKFKISSIPPKRHRKYHKKGKHEEKEDHEKEKPISTIDIDNLLKRESSEESKSNENIIDQANDYIKQKQDLELQGQNEYQSLKLNNKEPEDIANEYNDKLVEDIAKKTLNKTKKIPYPFLLKTTKQKRAFD